MVEKIFIKMWFTMFGTPDISIYFDICYNNMVKMLMFYHATPKKFLIFECEFELKFDLFQSTNSMTA